MVGQTQQAQRLERPADDIEGVERGRQVLRRAQREAAMGGVKTGPLGGCGQQAPDDARVRLRRKILQAIAPRGRNRQIREDGDHAIEFKCRERGEHGEGS